MDMELDRWWSIYIVVQRTRPFFSNPLPIFRFSLYFLLSPRLCLSTIDMLIDRSTPGLVPICLSLFFLFLSRSSSPLYIHVVCIVA